MKKYLLEQNNRTELFHFPLKNTKTLDEYDT